jgi:CheY-like chemotaxis protein
MCRDAIPPGTTAHATDDAYAAPGLGYVWTSSDLSVNREKDRSHVEIDRRNLSMAGPFDGVITNLGMPHVDGRKVTASIGRASPGTPVILLTGWGQRHNAAMRPFRHAVALSVISCRPCAPPRSQSHEGIR